MSKDKQNFHVRDLDMVTYQKLKKLAKYHRWSVNTYILSILEDHALMTPLQKNIQKKVPRNLAVSK